MTSKEAIPNDPWIDRVVDNRYRVLERIGHGGMGAVYKVVHTGMGKIAAMKLLHTSLSGDKELINRFHREATAISKLNHPNIVQVFDFGRVDNSVYLVMEYLRGEDLGNILKRDGPLEFVRVAPILIQICDALTEAHDAGIIHRDLKPENVRVSRTKDGQDFVKVLDFGLAKIVEEDESVSDITAKGNLVGTPYYMSPELIRAQPLDQRCDIYSVGALSYRILTGQSAFMAKSPVGVLTKHLTEDPVPPSQRVPDRMIPPEVDAIVLKAMAKNREDRHQDAQELKRHIVEVALKFTPRATQAPSSWESSSSISGPILRRGSDRYIGSERSELELLPTGRIEESIPTAHPILSKEDFAFERRLKRGRVLKLLSLIPLLGGAAFAVYWFGFRTGDLVAITQEIEPNNSPETATPLFQGKLLSGSLGKRVSDTESDRDFYKILVTGSGPQLLQARVSRIPNMDITLELYDRMAGRMTSADSAGRGGGEVITNWTVGPGVHFLLVREVWQVNTPPTENVTDLYHIQVKWQPVEADWEVEPNDRPEQAHALAVGGTLHAYLGEVKDLDYVRIASGEGLLSGEVSALAGVDVVLEITPFGKPKVVIDDEGPSGPERFTAVKANGRDPLLVLIRRKDQQKSLPGQEPLGLDVPYTFSVHLAPLPTSKNVPKRGKHGS
jgi:eukaryotic-like serine/threonine-protein kinase